MKRRLFIASGLATLSVAVAARYSLPREAPATRVVEDYFSTSALWLSLMTSPKTEADFAGYKRVRVPRSAEFWRVIGEYPDDYVEMIKPVDWDICTGGFNMITHFGIHTAPTIPEGLFGGAMTPNVRVFRDVTVRMASILVSRS